MRYLLLLLCFFCINMYSQEFEIKDISKKELQEKFHPRDSVAPAATLFEKGELTMNFNDGWQYKLEVTKRVKIYNSDGYKYATVELPYYYGDNTSSREDIKKVKAYVYNLDDEKIKEEKIRRRDIIDEQTTEYRKRVKFTFPNLKPGSVIEYSYTHESPHIDDFPEWAFQDEIPVNHSFYKVVVPEFFGYNERVKGFHPIKKEVDNKIINISYRNNQNYESESGTSSTNAKIFEYQAHDIPKLKDEPFVNNHNNFITSIQHELSYYKDTRGTYKEFATNWSKAALMLQKSESFGVQLDDTSYYEEDINTILNQSTTAEEKIFNILNFVKTHMNWNDYVGIYCSDKLKRVYKDRTGNIADINLMMTSMLRYAGFEANPVLVSTINNGIPSPIVSTENYNYVVTAIEFNNNQILLLDASNPFTGPNLLPTRCLNWNGRLVRPNGTSKKIQLYPSKLSQDNFIMNLKLKENGNLDGQMRRQYTHQYAYNYRVKYSAVDQKEYVDKIQNELNLKVKDYKIQNIENISKPVVETISFEKENAFDVINGNLYLSPLLFLSQTENPFKQDQKERKLPINFTFPKSQKYIVNIDVPDGYAVDYMPETIAIGLPNDKGVYRFDIQKSPTGDLQIIVRKKLKSSILGSDYYQPLKDFYSNIVNKETDKIVLLKK